MLSRLAPLLALALLAAGCTSPSMEGPPAGADAPPREAPARVVAAPPPAAGTDVRAVAVLDDAFQPSATTVPLGGSVAWTNEGGAHSVTFSTRPIDRVLATGGSFSATFDAAGTFAYRCVFHDKMRGTVTVVDGAAPDAAAGPVIELDGGHHDERPVTVDAGTPVTWSNPDKEDATLAFRDRAGTLLVPAGGVASLVLPAGEHAWRDAREEGEWRLDDHDVGVIVVRP